MALPVAVTRHAEAITEAHGVHGALHEDGQLALMDAADEPGVGFAASTVGGFILPGFLPAFDAAATFVKVLDLLARRPTPAVDGGRATCPASRSRTRRS